MAVIVPFDKSKRKSDKPPTTADPAREVVIMPSIDMDAVRTAWANIGKFGKTHKPIRAKKSDAKD
jgi:hypothetical protein